VQAESQAGAVMHTGSEHARANPREQLAVIVIGHQHFACYFFF
jgi:hypothetical protein